MLRDVAVVALSLERTDARSMLIPLVRPKRRVVALIVLPVRLHVIEEIRATRVDENQRDVAVFPRGVAKFVETAIAMIWPRK